MKELEERYSKPYKLNGKLFQYNYTRCIVEYIQILKEDMEYIGKKGDIFVIDEAGLSKEHWNNKEVRNEYLNSWIEELEETFRIMEHEVIEEFGGV